jgi:acyl carrier protein
MASESAESIPLSFEEFQTLIAKQLHVKQEDVRREASFIHDLQADSIQLVEMMLNIEEMGVNIPLESAWEIETVGDAYQHYRDSLSSGK